MTLISSSQASFWYRFSSPAPTLQQFAQGQKYNYVVEGTVNIFLTGSPDKQETGIKLLGQASVTAIGNCGYELAVQNLAISGPDGKVWKYTNIFKKIYIL